MTLRVEVHAAPGVDPPVPVPRLEGAVREVLRAERCGDAEVSLALVDDSAMVELNRRYLGKGEPTDVIAFSLHDEGEAPAGDLYVGVDQARRQACEHGVTPEEETLRLAVHATLHLLGWDHPDEERERSPMYRRQEELLAGLTAAPTP